jgi:hypothetical protein
MKVEQGQQEHMGDLSTSGLGDSIPHLLTHVSIPHIFECPLALVPLGLDLTKQNMPPWTSLWYTGSLDFWGSPWTPIAQCAASRLSREEEVTWRPRNYLSDITSSVACRGHYIMATNVCKIYPDSPVFPGIHEVLVLLKGTLLRWKPRNSLTSEYIILMDLIHSIGVFVCVWARGCL